MSFQEELHGKLQTDEAKTGKQVTKIKNNISTHTGISKHSCACFVVINSTVVCIHIVHFTVVYM